MLLKIYVTLTNNKKVKGLKYEHINYVFFVSRKRTYLKGIKQYNEFNKVIKTKWALCLSIP